MATRPPYFPYIDSSESNQVDLSISPLRTTGWQPGQPVPSAEHNTAWCLGAWWQTYLDYGTIHREDWINSAVDQRWSASRLAYTVGQEIDAVGADVLSYGTYSIRGYRVRVDDSILVSAGASPLLVPGATLPGRVWVYAGVNSLSPPGQPTAVVRVESVGVGVAATPGANELALVGVDVDAAGTVTANSYPAVEPAYQIDFTGPEWNVPSDLHFAKVDCSELLIAGAGLTTPLTVTPSAAGPSVVVTGDGVFSAVTIDGDTFGALLCTANHATEPAIRGVNTDDGPGLFGHCTGTNGRGGECYGAGTGAGFYAVGGVTGDGLHGVGGANSGSGVKGSGGGTGGYGGEFSGTGAFSGASCLGSATSAVSHGIVAAAVHTDAHGGRFRTANSVGTTTTANAVRAEAFGDGTGLHAVAVNGRAIIAESDTSAPERAPLRVVPQDTDPVTTTAGDVWFASDRDKFRIDTSTDSESVHSSPKGWVKGFAADADGSTAGGVNLASVTITPEVAGDVLITATGYAEMAAPTDSFTLTLRETGNTIQTQVEYQATSGPGWSWTIRCVYTLPDATARTFDVRLAVAAGGPLDYSNVVLSVEGVQ